MQRAPTNVIVARRQRTLRRRAGNGSAWGEGDLKDMGSRGWKGLRGRLLALGPHGLCDAAMTVLEMRREVQV